MSEALARFSKARIQLLARNPFFSTLAMELRVTIVDDIRTAAVTPDAQLFLNEDFVAAQDDAKLVGLLCHEVLHPALMIFQRMEDREPVLSNIVHDHVINIMIYDSDLSLPDGALLNMDFRGFSFEFLYDLFEKEFNRQGRCTPCLGENGHCAGVPAESIPYGGGGEPDWVERAVADEVSRISTESWAIGSDVLGQKVIGIGGARRLGERWREVLTQARIAAEKSSGWGSLPHALQIVVSSITEPQLSWRDILSRWVGEKSRRDDYTYRRPGRREPLEGLLMPSMMGTIADVAILIDTSGSMLGEPIAVMLSEMREVIEELGCASVVVVCDAEVHEVIDDPDTVMEVIEGLGGGGGSNFVPAFERLEEEQWQGPVIAATDGYITVPSEEPIGMAVLWLLDRHGEPPTNWGEVLRLPE